MLIVISTNDLRTSKINKKNQKKELQKQHIITPYNTCLNRFRKQTPRKCFRNKQTPRY